MNHAGNQTLPKGWRWVRLREVCSDIYRYPSFYGMEHLPKGIPVVRGEHIDAKGEISTNWNDYWFVSSELSDKFPRTVLSEGDLVFTVRGTIGKVGIVRSSHQGAQLSPNLIRISPCSSISSTYLWYYLQLIRGSESEVENNAVTVATVKASDLISIRIPLAPLPEQKRIAATLNDQMVAVERAQVATEAHLELLARLIESYLRHSLSTAHTQRIELGGCLIEVSKGVGAAWKKHLVVGATRAGAAPAKENVGKKPERYKLVDIGTIFYNPMRILLGSIGMIDVDEEAGITSPDYVVFKTRNGVLHPRWFYFWLRSRFGDAFIKTLTRGAVRERMLFKRLAAANMEIPPWKTQVDVADKLRTVFKARRALMDQMNVINKLPTALLRRAFNGEL
jgi:type I restriction enzyme S subunit